MLHLENGASAKQIEEFPWRDNSNPAKGFERQKVFLVAGYQEVRVGGQRALQDSVVLIMREDP